MIILVADTSVLIDLERGNLLRIALAANDTIATPDLLYEQELAAHNGPDLLALGLQIMELNATELALVQELRMRQSRLSTPDCAAYVGAQRDNHLLLAGDGLLRRHAQDTEIPCHGVLWLLDRLLAQRAATSVELHTGLTAISNHQRCRLPPTDVQARLAAWSPLE